MRIPRFTLTLLWLISAILLPNEMGQAADGPATAPSASYRGRVVGPDNQPIAGARVSAYLYESLQKSIPPVGTATTDARGEFTVQSPSERFTLVVQAEGLGLSVRSTSPAAEIAPAEILLKTPTSVRVHVTGPGDAPLAGVRVGVAGVFDRLDGSSIGGGVPMEIQERLIQTTDAAGVCTFTGMPRQGSLNVRIASPEYAYQFTSIPTGDTDLTDGAPIRIARGVIIEGRVIRTDTGLPVPDVAINDNSRSGNTNRGSSARTDADGNFRITQAAAGEHKLSVILSLPLSSELTMQRFEPIALVEGQQIKDIELKLVPGNVISGKVTRTGTGKPIVGARIGISAGGDGPFGSAGANAETGEDGSFIVRVLPGTYSASISGLARIGYLLPRPNSRPVTVTEGQEETVDFQCEANPNPAVKGRVVDADGKPVVGATATASVSSVIAGSFSGPDSIIAAGDRSGGTAVTDARGEFEIPFVTDGALLQVRKGNLRQSQPVTIDASHRTLELVLLESPRGTMIVHVVDETGQPLADVPVMLSWTTDLSNSIADRRTGKTGTDGAFRVASLPTQFEYSIAVGGPGFSTSQVRQIKIEPGKDNDLPPMTSRVANSFISGVVKDVNGKPVEGLIVWASGSSSQSPDNVRTDAQGRFRIGGLVPGSRVVLNSREATTRGGTYRGTPFTAGSENVELIFDPTPPGRARRGAGGAPAAPQGRGNIDPPERQD